MKNQGNDGNWSGEGWRKFQKTAALRARAAKVIDINLLDSIIADVMKTIGPQLRQFKIDLPAKINEAIRELKAQKSRGVSSTKAGQGCGGNSRYMYDSAHKLRKICQFDKGNALDDFCAGR